MSAPKDFPGIIRDKAYTDTLHRDTLRQKVRRLAHQWERFREDLSCIPRWERAKDNKFFKLSTCIITMNSAERIRPLLQYIRPFTDEIVVGVDSKTTDNTFDTCQGLVDELFIVESTAQTCNAGLETLVSHCHGDWVLRLDDDEFPEPELARWLPGIIAHPKYTHYKLPRLHVSSIDPLMWVNDGYLYPDFQMRLFKNDPKLLHFPGAVGHSSIECDGPRGKIHSANLVHLNLAINPRFKREDKLKTYIDRLNGGWVHPINQQALLFEDFNYRIEPYRHPDTAFCERLSETTRHQRQVYERQKYNHPGNQALQASKPV